jgi:3-oxoacyl-[acyl-carrier protein] reductase
MKLLGRVAVVTGGGRGIGEAIALALAREGADIALVSRTIAEVERTADHVRAIGRDAIAVTADVSSWGAIRATMEHLLGHYGRVHILVNSAGIQAPIGPSWENDPEQWVRTLLVNTGGTFFCCRALIPSMIEHGGGKIINLSGGGAATLRPRFSAYAASKAAIVRFTETLAEEVKPFDIQVNAIAPGTVNTRMTDEVLAAPDAAGHAALAQAQMVSENNSPPDAAAELAVFLASPESNGLTGKLISAVWDDWRSFAGHLDEIMASDMYTLRRVTTQKPKEKTA